MQLVCVPHQRPRLTKHFLNCCRVQRPNLSRVDSQAPPHLDCPRAPFLQRCVVQVRIRIRIQDLVRKR